MSRFSDAEMVQAAIQRGQRGRVWYLLDSPITGEVARVDLRDRRKPIVTRGTEEFGAGYFYDKAV